MKFIWKFGLWHEKLEVRFVAHVVKTCNQETKNRNLHDIRSWHCTFHYLFMCNKLCPLHARKKERCLYPYVKSWDFYPQFNMTSTQSNYYVVPWQDHLEVDHNHLLLPFINVEKEDVHVLCTNSVLKPLTSTGCNQLHWRQAQWQHWANWNRGLE